MGKCGGGGKWTQAWKFQSEEREVYNWLANMNQRGFQTSYIFLKPNQSIELKHIQRIIIIQKIIKVKGIRIFSKVLNVININIK